MKFKLRILILSAIIPLFNISDASEVKQDLQDCKQQIKVSVNGLVCDFCARALEKVFSKKVEVAGIEVNLDDSIVLLDLKKQRNLDDNIVTKLINDSGYDVVSINRSCYE